MKMVLLVLGGDARHIRDVLATRHPQADVEEMPRAKIESGGMTQRLSALRALRPDIFAVATERLAWQRGQNAFLLFGALAGARRTIILDAHGGVREESRSRSLVASPARLAREAAISASALRRASKQLRHLEVAIKRGEHLKSRPQKNAESDTREIVYVR